MRRNIRFNHSKLIISCIIIAFVFLGLPSKIWANEETIPAILNKDKTNQLIKENDDDIEKIILQSGDEYFTGTWEDTNYEVPAEETIKEHWDDQPDEERYTSWFFFPFGTIFQIKQTGSQFTIRGRAINYVDLDRIILGDGTGTIERRGDSFTLQLNFYDRAWMSPSEPGDWWNSYDNEEEYHTMVMEGVIIDENHWQGSYTHITTYEYYWDDHEGGHHIDTDIRTTTGEVHAERVSDGAEEPIPFVPLSEEGVMPPASLVPSDTTEGETQAPSTEDEDFEKTINQSEELSPESGPLPSTKEQESQVIGGAIAGGLIGSVTATAAAAAIQTRRSTLTKKTVYSPVDGKPVSASQAAYEQGQLDNGMIYDAGSDSFKWADAPVWKPPKQSILTRQAEEERTAVRAERARKRQEEEAKRNLARKREINQEMEQYQKEYASHMADVEKWDSYSKVASTVENTADFAMGVCEKIAGPAGKPIAAAYGLAKDAIQVTNEVIDHGLIKGLSKSIIDKGKDKLKEKFTSLIPTYKFSGGKYGATKFQKFAGKYIPDEYFDAIGNQMVETGAGMIFDEGIKLPQNILDEKVDLTPQQILKIQQFLLGGK